jgi:outer membrane immunogenic protein
MFRARITRAVLALCAFTVCSRVSYAADFGSDDTASYSSFSPNDRRPLDGSYRYGPMSWTGIYLGGHLGWGAGGADGTGLVSQDVDASGFLAGLHAGYNFQYHALVAGLEGDIDWTTVDGEETVGGRTLTANANWLSSLRLRFGYAHNNLLIYGTGGAAFAGTDFNVSGAGPDATLSDTVVGYAIGVGAEYAFTHALSARVEALHYNFGDQDFVIGNTPSTVDLDLTTIRAGLSFKLN